MDRFTIDKGRLTLKTRAKGALSRLAHDLVIESAALSGEVSREEGRWRGEVRVTVASLRVLGTVEGMGYRSDGLSEADRREIERRIVKEVFSGRQSVTAQLTGSPERLEVRVTAGARAGVLSAQVVLDEVGAGRLRVRGQGSLSMRALGLPEVRGPLGVFKVADEVGYEIEATLAALPSTPNT